MNIELLSFDIDNTLIELETRKTNFPSVWSQIQDTENVILCYNTGRLLDDVLQLIKRQILPEPQYIISGVGTNIYDVKAKKLLKEFSQILEEGWNLDLVKEKIEALPLPISSQPKRFQHDFKKSYFFENASSKDLKKIEKTLITSDLDVNVVYSGNKFLDILPKYANKGNALQWLLAELDIKAEQTIVAGDSGNDSAMFIIPKIKGIVVANAQEELFRSVTDLDVYLAKNIQSKGVLEGLHHYKVIPQEIFENYLNSEIQDEKIIQHLDEQENKPVTDDELKFIIEGYDKAVEAVKLNITRLGFSACSLTHNSSTGTDENYRSVWGRDGAITVIGTIPLVGDEAIRNCQRQTLETLISNITLNGQIPSNVSIDTNVPDYSGVGGICSIDSGLWFIIAFYEYVNATNEHELLRKHLPALKKVMNWLSAQDGNNDALLEIPEAGDWTDLFGRSYNVLYDEILWYRANVCFGRLLEEIGERDDAGAYLRWSHVIKKAIISNFWPSTQTDRASPFAFADQQFSLGDASYLIAQVTPFDFSWRCDVYGNVLAYLFDVLDTEKAQSAFRFMWGVGVNEPYPVANVYPVVSPGDPDWRPYYAVNLLNLPNHYHNGGIWPFVGSAWVRFVHKLGLASVARKELYKLAKLNHLGINQEWEFNEWAHGQTGRPMGKIYQAWSAAEYISTCHYLKIK